MLGRGRFCFGMGGGVVVWEPGRQGTGYWKKKLWSFWRTDAYILRYPEGSGVPWHRDPIPGRKHFRLNVVLRCARLGGFVVVAGHHGIRLPGRLNLFRPDIQAHMVFRVLRGERWVLSFGLAV